MADTKRTLATLQTLLADNASGDISPQDVRDALVSTFGFGDWLAFKPGSPGTPDSDWAGGLGNYTAVGTGSGTVSLLQTTTTTNIYDLASRPGWLLIQVGQAQTAEFRCDYTIPDGSSIVLALAGAPQAEAGDNMSLAVRLNDNDTSSTSGNYVAAMLEADSGEFLIQGNSSADAGGKEMGVGKDEINTASATYLRIVRQSLTYTCWASRDGWTWTYVFSQTLGGAATNVWISALGPSAATYMPIIAIPWIREGTDDLDPW